MEPLKSHVRCDLIDENALRYGHSLFERVSPRQRDNEVVCSKCKAQIRKEDK